MSELQTIVRTRVSVDDVDFLLAQEQDVDKLKGEIEAALRAGPRFVEFVVLGNRSVSILLTAATHVMISVDTVHVDHLDVGDDAAPFGGSFDLL